MPFQPIYYIAMGAPTIEKSMAMARAYALHGARAFQFDMPSSEPIYETELVKEFMRGARARYAGYEPYMEALAALRAELGDIEIHCVLYPDVIRSIGLARLRRFVDAARVSSVMVAGGDPEVLAALRGAGIAVIGRIDRMLIDAQLREISACPPDSVFNFNYKRHREQQPHGCASFADKIAYIRRVGVKARILAVEGIGNGEMMREVRAAGADGALLGNALMRLWDRESELWALLEEFQAAAEGFR